MEQATLFAKSRLSTIERSALLDIFLASCRWTRIYLGWRPNLRVGCSCCARPRVLNELGAHYAVQGIANSATGRTGMTRIVGPADPVDALPPNDAIALNSEFT